MLNSWPCECSAAISDLAAWLLLAHWRQTWTRICNQKPPVPELICCLEAGWWLPRHICYGILLHLDSSAWGVRYNKPAFQHAPIIWLFCFSQPIFNGTVGLFLARRENYYISKVIPGCSVLFVYREVRACLCPQNNLEMNRAQLCCSLFPRLLFLSAPLAQIFCLQEICPRATLSITFSYFSWLPASNVLPTANLLSSAFATHSVRPGFSSCYSFMPCIM